MQDAKKISSVVLNEQPITIEQLVAVARYGATVHFSRSYEKRVNASRGLVEKFLIENRRIYGVTTGFGDNVSKVITPDQAVQLQKNILRSHAVSVGEVLAKELVRAVQVAILVNLGQGYSGVSLTTLALLRDLLNKQITPFAPGEGSVAYLAPEAHMALVLIGEGQAWYRGELMSGSKALKQAGLQPIDLGCKEGLALVNGTTSVTAFAALTVYDAIQTTKTADIAGAMSFEMLKGTIKAFDPRLHSLKKHEEQASTADNLRRILAGSQQIEHFKDYRLQDACSLRIIPHVHGAAKRSIKQAHEAIGEELNSCSDNPILYPEEADGVALMGGNFDATFVGIQADSLCIALSVLAKEAERRIDRLVNHHVSELPSFLIKNPGLNSGYMIPQYTAAGLYTEMKLLSHPASIDNIPTCAGQEDVVSFAYLAAKKATQVVKKLQYILAIELMCAAQAADFHTLDPSPTTRAVIDEIRNNVPSLLEDRFIYPDMETIYQYVQSGRFIEIVEKIIGELAF